MFNESLVITNEEISRELNGVSPSKIATGLLNLERILKHLKNSKDKNVETDTLKFSDEELIGCLL